MTPRALAVAALLATATSTPPVRADEPRRATQVPERARELARRGRAYHDAGDYARAIAAFKEAYVLAPSPELLFNLGQAYRLSGQCDEAAWMYHRYLDSHPPREDRELAQAQLHRAEQCGHGGLRMAILPPSLDSQSPATPKAPPRSSRHPAAKPSRGRAPEAVAPETVAGESTRARHEKQLGAGLAIGGGILLAGATYFALDARDAAATVSNAYEQGESSAEIRKTDARGRRSATLATAFAIGGGAALATGGLLYLLGRHHAQTDHLAVVPTAHGAEVHLAWTF